MNTLLELSGLSVTFGGLTAVDDVSFEIKEGEILGLIGPNGAGKTTLFNAVCGLIRPSSGFIRLGDDDITRLPPRKRMQCGIQRTFQSIQLVRVMSVLENIMLGLHTKIPYFPFGSEEEARSTRESRGAIECARDIAEFVGVLEVLDLPVDQVSYREQRLTEFGRAIASGPRLLLLDEPAAGLSDSEIRELDALIMKIRDQLGITVLLVEHVMALVLAISDRVAVLESGRLLTIGTAEGIAADSRVREAYLGKNHA